MNIKHLIGRKIEHVVLNKFDDGMGGTATDPFINLDNGATLRFVAQETEVGEYGVKLVYVANRKRKTPAARPQPVAFTEDERLALIEAIDLALGDQKHYMQVGGGATDYGDEWQEVAARKAATFRNMAEAVRKLGGIQIAIDCETIAAEFDEVQANA